MLMSATTSDDVDRLRELMLHSAVDVVATAAAAAGDARPNTAAGTAAEIEHFRIDCDRYLAFYGLTQTCTLLWLPSCSVDLDIFRHCITM